jgi:hypothetical protein
VVTPRKIRKVMRVMPVETKSAASNSIASVKKGYVHLSPSSRKRAVM